MKTKSMLRRKAAFSYVYLLLAIFAVALPFLSQKDIFYLSYMEYVPYTYGRLFPEIFFSFQILFLWAAVVCYAFNFYKGAIYYPRFYRRNMRNRWSKWENFIDGSAGRGTVSTVLVFLYFSYFVFVFPKEELVPAILRDYFWLWAFVWIGFNFLLNRASQTASFFQYRSAIVDPLIINPEAKYGKINFTVGFYLPKGEDEHLFALRAVKAYLKWSEEEKADREKNKMKEEAKIRDFSGQVVAFKEE
jgi:hypothetical protein